MASVECSQGSCYRKTWDGPSIGNHRLVYDVMVRTESLEFRLAAKLSRDAAVFLHGHLGDRVCDPSNGQHGAATSSHSQNPVRPALPGCLESSVGDCAIDSRQDNWLDAWPLTIKDVARARKVVMFPWTFPWTRDGSLFWSWQPGGDGHVKIYSIRSALRVLRPFDSHDGLAEWPRTKREASRTTPATVEGWAVGSQNGSPGW